MACNNIMIVEDEDAIREMLALSLELDGYKIHSAANGKIGLDLLQTIEPPNLILLDLMMPVMNGWQFVEALDKNPSTASIPIVIVTAFGEKVRTIRSNGVLKKPIALDSLYKMVEKFCGRPQPPGSVT